MDQTKDYKSRRKHFMETYENNIVLTKMIPEIATQLFHDEFGINMYDISYIPITFTTGWSMLLKFIGTQPVDEFAIDVCGISVEYVTDYSESDKSSNIVPQMIHRKAPVFIKQHNQLSDGASYTNELLTKYNSWRSVNLLETIDKLERDIYASILDEYGIDLIVSATVFPLLAATYAAGLQFARESKQTVNMYNIFEIDVVDGDRVLLTPLSTVKQYLKDDSKK